MFRSLVNLFICLAVIGAISNSVNGKKAETTAPKQLEVQTPATPVKEPEVQVSAPTITSHTRVPGNPGKMDTLIAYGLAASKMYADCGGTLSSEQAIALIDARRAGRGPLIDYFYKEMKQSHDSGNPGSTCAAIKPAYEKFMLEVARQAQ
jgi:hypothetical protein